MNDDNTGRHKRPDLVMDDAPLELSTDEREELLSDSQRRRHAARFPPGTPVLQTAEDRDLAVRRRNRPGYSRGVPGEPADEEVTDPLALLPREPEERDIEAVRQAGREPDQPAATVDLRAAMRILKTQMRKERLESEQRQAAELRELLDRPPRDVSITLARDMGFIKKVAGVIAVGLLGVAGTVAKGLYDRGGHEMAVEMRIEQLRRDVDRMDAVIERLERRDAIPPFPTQKGQLP